MKLIAAEYTFDNSKVLFYFTADGRVDFRELVRDLASVFRTRIELRQVGVRDETKLAGGIGMCGRELCCHSYLSEFIPVSIKMAKEQNLSLNPTKISGSCGRLMCCLKYEQDTYEYLNSKLPNPGDTVTTVDGITGEVASVNVLRQSVRILVVDEEGNKEAMDYKIADLKFKPKRRRRPDNDKHGKNSNEDAYLKALEALEKQDGKSNLD
jgi:cell fate regulator YaaT (PSP1 superfamily)